MTTDDIVDITTSRTVTPRPPQATSIPSLLSIFQNEWDVLALETFQVRQQLYQTRQELSTALYQHDAACRVIARITKERDEAREALSRVSEDVNGSSSTHDQMQTDEETTAIPQDIQEIANATLAQESAGRKKRKVPEGWATAEDLSNFQEKTASPSDSTAIETPAITGNHTFSALHPSHEFFASANGSRTWTLIKSGSDENLCNISIESSMIFAFSIYSC